jgi:PilZ domain
MIYEFYWRDPIKGYQPIGVRPERRKNPERITKESVINLAKGLVGDNVDVNDIYFTKITKDENSGEILRPNSVYRPVREYFEDRRKSSRVHIELPLEYRVKHDARPHGGIVIDASESGFLIYSTENIPIGTKLKMAVLFSTEYEMAEFEVFAEIIWKNACVEKEEEGYQYGLRFVQVLEEDYRKLGRLLSGRFE